MRIDEQLHSMLEVAAAGVPDHLSDVEETIRRGERRRRRRRMSVGLWAAAATALALFAGAGLVNLGEATPDGPIIGLGRDSVLPPAVSEGIVAVSTADGTMAAELVLSSEEAPPTLGLTAVVINQGEIPLNVGGAHRTFHLERWDGDEWVHVHTLPTTASYTVAEGGRSGPFRVGYAGNTRLEPGWYAIRKQVVGRTTTEQLNLRARFRVVGDADLDARFAGPAEPVLVADASAMGGPAEPGLWPGSWLVDIVTERGDLTGVWRRFSQEGEPPDVDLRKFGLVFISFASGGCSKAFHELHIDGNRMEVRLVAISREGGYFGPGEQVPQDPASPQFACLPLGGIHQTIVIAIDRTVIPNDGFILEVVTSQSGDPRRFALSGEPMEVPPDISSGPYGDVVGDGIGFHAEPHDGMRGDQVEIVATNAADDTARSQLTTVLEHWNGQRWRPVHGQQHVDQGSLHAAVQRISQTVPAGETAIMYVVDTSHLEPGWYAVRASILSEGRDRTLRATFVVHP